MSAPGFEYFTSADAGAPVLTGQVGKMILLLDWLLVTKGGWAKAYSGTNLAAYRSDTGNRFYLRVDDTQTKFARMRGYRAMTAISSGSNIFPATAYAAAANWGAGKSISADSTARKYWGIRTNGYVMLYVELGNPTIDGAISRNLFVFGDVPSLCETDSYNTVILGSESPNTSGFPHNYTPFSGQYSSLTSAISGPFMAATPSGGLNTPATVLDMPYGQSNVYTVADPNYLKSGRIQFQSITLLSAEVAAGGSGPGIARAKLPNIHVGLGLLPNVHLADGGTFSIGSRNFKALQSALYDPSADGGASYASGYILLETSDTDGML